ncbi:MAG TPA: hypothetical protein ENF94_01535 [Candidatus Woesearchaeota archaeon]|nr:MAG: hypothetical protein DRJ25_02820 [Candidatus Woesearchaeota archaeon]HDD70823.1 hypothetical protein [Candidatus Woesearchaeota archaeon]
MDWNVIFGFLKVVYDNLLVCIFILLFGFIMGKGIGLLVESLLRGVEINKLLKKLGSDFAFDKALSQLAVYSVYIITFLVLLQYLGIRNLVLIVLLIIFVVVLGISFVFALLMFLPNFFFGFFLRKHLKKGAILSVGKIRGRILKVRFSDVLVQSGDDILAVPYVFIRKMSKE